MTCHRLEKSKYLTAVSTVFALVAGGFVTQADAALLNANSGGTFTMNLDRDALALSNFGSLTQPGYFLAQYFDTIESDYTTRTDSSFYFNNPTRVEIPAVNLVHDITPVSASNPSGQLSGRNVQATTPDFSIDSDTLAGTGTMGMTGVEMFRGSFSGTLLNGDYSLKYDPEARQTMWDAFGVSGTPGGWYLQNNVSFSAVAYELANLRLQYSSAGDWMLSGDLLLSPENAFFLKNAVLADLGDFCLGVGAYSGCGQVAAVPLPSAVWFFASGIAGIGINGYRRFRRA